MRPPSDIWISSSAEFDRRGKPCLFLDRDGVVVKETHYLSRVQDVALEHGAVDLIQAARAIDLSVVVVTNQAGIAKGLFDLEQYVAVEAEIERLLKAQGAKVDLTIACPYHPDFTPNYSTQMEQWRKPGPAMLEFAGHHMGIRLERSWIVGDRASDIEAGRNAKINGAFHVETGHGRVEREKAASLETKNYPVIFCRTPADTATRLRDLFTNFS